MIADATATTLSLRWRKPYNGNVETLALLRDPPGNILQHLRMLIPLCLGPVGEGAGLGLNSYWIRPGGCPCFIPCMNILPYLIRSIINADMA